MTLSVSSSPVHLDLATINEVQTVVVRELRNQVCAWEQESLDAANRGDYRSAQMLRDWSIAADLLASKASSACTALFLDTCQSFPLVEDTRVVALPNINRSAKDRHLDALTIDVASQQPDPDPA